MRNLNKKLASQAMVIGLATALSLSAMSTTAQAAVGPQCVMECPGPNGNLLDRVLAALGLR